MPQSELTNKLSMIKIHEWVCAKSNYEEEIVGRSLPFLWKVIGIALCLFENDNSEILKQVQNIDQFDLVQEYESYISYLKSDYWNSNSEIDLS